MLISVLQFTLHFIEKGLAVPTLRIHTAREKPIDDGSMRIAVPRDSWRGKVRRALTPIRVHSSVVFLQQ